MALSLRSRLVHKADLGSENFLLVAEAPEIASKARPGQFVMASESDGFSLPHPLLGRALAVYNVNRPSYGSGTVELFLKVVGDGTARLSSLVVGQKLHLVGPLGNGFDTTATTGREQIFVVAGGTGIASVLGLSRALVSAGSTVILFYGARTSADLFGLEDFRQAGVEIVVTTEDGSMGHKGLVTKPLGAAMSAAPPQTPVFACGPNPMMEAVVNLSRSHGLPCTISVETKMACGFGVCLGCTVKTTSGYRLACTHGPVFDGLEFVWESAMHIGEAAP